MTPSHLLLVASFGASLAACSSGNAAPPATTFSLSIVGEGTLFDEGPVVSKLCDSAKLGGDATKPRACPSPMEMTGSSSENGFYLTVLPAAGFRFGHWDGTCVALLAASGTSDFHFSAPSTPQNITCVAYFVSP